MSAMSPGHALRDEGCMEPAPGVKVQVLDRPSRVTGLGRDPERSLQVWEGLRVGCR